MENKNININEHLVQSLELSFLNKILDDNTRFLQTRIADYYFKDPLARTIYGIVGLTITKVGQFQPLIHLDDLCKDEKRMEKYNSLEYPLEINEPIDIINYIEKFKNDTINFETMEEELVKRYTREKLTELAYEILDNVDNSKMHPSELMIKTSASLDKMIYDTHDSTVTKTASEVADDFLSYLYSDEVTTHIPSGIGGIDCVTGGTPKNGVFSWVAPAKEGKSTLLVESIVDNLKRDRVCAVYTIEMSIETMMQRIYCNYAGVTFEKITKKTYTPEERQHLIDKTIEFKEAYSDKFFIYYTTEGLTTKHIESHVANIKKAGVIVDDIFIDYLQILDSYTKNNAPKAEKMAEIPKEVRLLRQKTGARIFVPIQSLSSSREKAIEDWTGDDIYYSKEAEREFDYVAAMKKEDGYIKWRKMVSRFNPEDDTMFYPDADYNYMYMGEAIKWDDSYITQDNENDVDLLEAASWEPREKKRK